MSPTPGGKTNRYSWRWHVLWGGIKAELIFELIVALVRLFYSLGNQSVVLLEKFAAKPQLQRSGINLNEYISGSLSMT